MTSVADAKDCAVPHPDVAAEHAHGAPAIRPSASRESVPSVTRRTRSVKNGQSATRVVHRKHACGFRLHAAASPRVGRHPDDKPPQLDFTLTIGGRIRDGGGIAGPASAEAALFSDRLQTVTNWVHLGLGASTVFVVVVGENLLSWPAQL